MLFFHIRIDIIVIGSLSVYVEETWLFDSAYSFNSILWIFWNWYFCLLLICKDSFFTKFCFGCCFVLGVWPFLRLVATILKTRSSDTIIFCFAFKIYKCGNFCLLFRYLVLRLEDVIIMVRKYGFEFKKDFLSCLLLH